MAVKGYLQFPVAVLSMALTYADMLRHIRSFAIVSYAKKKHANVDIKSEAAREIRAAFPNVQTNEIGYFLAAKELAIPAESITEIKRQFNAVKSHAALQNGPSEGPQVRLSAKVFNRVFRERSLSEPEFRLLCAIYSAIGKQKMRRITKEELQQRCIGFPSPRQNVQSEKWMTAHQLRKTRDNLYKLRFFAMLTYGRRQTYYSNRLDEEALAAQIMRSKTEGQRRKSANRQASASMTQRIRDEKRRLALSSGSA